MVIILQSIVHCDCLVVLELENTMIHGHVCPYANQMRLLSLSMSPYATKGLILLDVVPPGVDKYNSVGCCQVQRLTTALQPDDLEMEMLAKLTNKGGPHLLLTIIFFSCSSLKALMAFFRPRSSILP